MIIWLIFTLVVLWSHDDVVVAGEAVAGDAVAGDAVAGDAVAGDAVAGDAVVVTVAASDRTIIQPDDRTFGQSIDFDRC